MISNFGPIIAAYPSRTIELCLLDEHSLQFVFQLTDFKIIDADC